MTTKPLTMWIGYEPREAEAFAVCRESIRHFNRNIAVRGLVLRDLENSGLYRRPTRDWLGKMWDDISDAPMSTEFAISRFLVPILAKDYHHGTGWACFMDCDILVRCNMEAVKPLLDDSKAVYCVKHDYRPDNEEKMDGQIQTAYPRKNWSSVMFFNLDHEANKRLTVDLVNSAPGRDLHRFCWLEDSDIGELPTEWNYLVGHTENIPDPKIVHFTEGGPWFRAFREVEFASEWLAKRDQWAR